MIPPDKKSAVSSQLQNLSAKNAIKLFDEFLKSESIGLIFWENDKITAINPGTKKFFGINDDHVKNQSYLNILPAEEIKILGDVSSPSLLQVENKNGPVELRAGNIFLDNAKAKGITVLFENNEAEDREFIRSVFHPEVLHNEKFNKEEKKKYNVNDFFYDYLTELPNRLLFNEFLDLAVNESKQSGMPTAVAYIDLDRFKIINEMYGHAVGDQVIYEVSTRLKNCIRHEDVLIRLGGDEFGLILPGVNPVHTPAHIAQKIITALKEPIRIEKEELVVTPSIGIALYPTDSVIQDQITTYAELAMYEAKLKIGGNTYSFFNSEMSKVNEEYNRTEKYIRGGLLENLFSVYYQPKVNNESFEITGMEALVRLHIPEKGIIKPHVFIPVAEETGLIHLIGENVLKQACKQTHEWHLRGYSNLKVAVNVSTQQLMKQSFQEKVSEILEKTQMDPRYLELEITESDTTSDNETIQKNIRRLKDLGVTFSIDDFGIGYSSLGRIGSLPIDGIKIDKLFIEKITKQHKSSAIVKAILAIAHSLKLSVVAEGIESEDQINALKKHKNIELQGFKFSPPVPFDKFYELLRSRSFAKFH